MDHLDAWYRGRDLVAIVHYPYLTRFDDVTRQQAEEGCAQLGLCLDVTTDYAIHNPAHTTAVIISRVGLLSVLDGTAQATD